MEQPTIGIALSGGTAKSLAHIGILKALEEAGLRPHYMAATSGGAIVGAVYAAGTSIEDLTKTAEGLRWKHLARITWPRLGLLNNSGVERVLHDLVGEADFKDLKIPMAIVGTDLLTGDKVVFREGSVAKAAMISSSIPSVFEPIKADGTLYVDGGLVEYLPVETLVDSFQPDLVIAVNLGYREFRSPHPRHLLHISMMVTGIAARQNARISETKADVVIRPPTALFPAFDLQASAKLIEVGYRTAKQRIPDILAAMERKDEGWLDRIKFWSRS